MITIPPQDVRGKPDRQQVQEAMASAGLVLPDVAVLALQQGRLIEAIKLIRAANPGLDLARAKAVMERMQAQARRYPREKLKAAYDYLFELEFRRIFNGYYPFIFWNIIFRFIINK